MYVMEKRVDRLNSAYLQAYFVFAYTYFFYKKLVIRNPDSRMAKNLRNSSTGKKITKKLLYFW